MLDLKPFLNLILGHSLVRPGQRLPGSVSNTQCWKYAVLYPWHPVLGLSTNKNVVLMPRMARESSYGASQARSWKG